MGAVVGAVVSSVIGGGVAGAIGGALASTVTNGLLNGDSGGGGGGGGGGGQQASNSGSGGSTTPGINLPSNLVAGVTPGATSPITMGPSFSTPQTYNSDVSVMHAADGGSVDNPDPLHWESLPHHVTEGSPITAMHGTHPHLTGFEEMYPHFAEGGEAEHVPEFYSEGGLQHTYVKGGGNGTSDSVPAMLATGEFVIPADVVSALGNGDSDAGSKQLTGMLRGVRKHKQENGPDELPPDSKHPLDYLKGVA